MPSGLPGSEEPAGDHQLSDVIGLVVGDEHCFAESGLTLAVRNGRKKVRVGIFDQGLHRSEVGTEAFHARLPRSRIGRGRPFSGKQCSPPTTMPITSDNW